MPRSAAICGTTYSKSSNSIEHCVSCAMSVRRPFCHGCEVPLIRRVARHLLPTPKGEGKDRGLLKPRALPWARGPSALSAPENLLADSSSSSVVTFVQIEKFIDSRWWEN